MTGSARRIKIAPSILNADFGHLSDAIQQAEAGGADWIHVDVMDGLFVPNLTLGPMIVEAIRRATRLPLDIHLMIDDPRRYIGRFRDAGADWLTIHLEADRHPHRTLSEIRALGGKAGLALNPGTPVALAMDLVEQLDLLLIMSVNPGFGGQGFIEPALRKLSQARALLAQRNPACEIEVDGGVKLANAAGVAAAGATVVVAGSFIYLEGDSPGTNISALRRALDSV
ncbi:MAG TPA: ribulose-phosphate 3-epimerase [Chloroflexota bacterium]|jgi:ribulose-phosphate 3-epimerase|nr:ribulose-phosphate 3-epimerase [Chloroflexota bacterium]